MINETEWIENTSEYFSKSKSEIENELQTNRNIMMMRNLDTDDLIDEAAKIRTLLVCAEDATFVKEYEGVIFGNPEQEQRQRNVRIEKSPPRDFGDEYDSVEDVCD